MNLRREKVQLNNSGFSLVELIVVVLIMGILAGGATMAISTVSNADAQRAARNLSSMLTQARQLAMSTADSSNDSAAAKKVYAEIYFSDGYYYVDICSSITDGTGTTVTVEETKRLGNYHLDITYNESRGTGDNTLLYDQATSFGKRLRIGFDKGSGGIDRVGLVNADGSGTETALNTENKLTDIYCVGSRTEHIILVKETGKNYLD